MKKYKILFAIMIIALSVCIEAKPKIGVVGDFDYVLSEWLYEASVNYLPLSLSDLEPYILEKLDILIINEAPKLDDVLIRELKKYLRSGGKIAIFSGVLANDLTPELELEDTSLAFTLGITELVPVSGVELTFSSHSIILDEAYSFDQRRGVPLATSNNGKTLSSLNNNALVFGIKAITTEYEDNKALKELFLNSLLSFSIDKTVLVKAREKIDLNNLSLENQILFEIAFDLENNLEKMSVGDAYENFDQALSIYNDCYLYSLHASSVETRAVWFRPPTSKYTIIESLDALEELGFNLIFVETWWEGALLYPNGPVSQRNEFRGWDPLEFIIEEAHKRGIEVHAWLEVFFSGYQRPGEILEKHPDWAAVGIDGRVAVKAEDDKYFIEPAHKEAQAFLINMFVEMVEKYDLDGIHLDYIRYPLGNPVPYSFSPYIKDLFSSSTSLEFPTSTNHKNWPIFSKFKEEQVTSFVKKLREEVLNIKPIQISAAVFPGNDALINKNQNWPLWIEEGYLDFISLMLYSRQTNTVENWIIESQKQIGGKIPYYPALAAISIPEGDLLVEQTMLIHKYDLPGVAFFAWNHFNDDIIETLKKGPFRVKAKREQF